MRQLTLRRCSACLASPAFAQTEPTAGSLPSRRKSPTGTRSPSASAVRLVPDYEGSDDYRIIPAGAIRGKVSGISFTTRGTYLYVDVVPRARQGAASTPDRSSGLRFNSRRHIDD